MIFRLIWRWNEDGVWTRLNPGDLDPDTGRTYLGPPKDARLARGERVIVDEAGMLDQDTAHALLTVTAEAGATVALVGDRAQLPAVGRGGVLDMAAHTQAGCYTAPRGRTYKKDKLSSLDEDTFGSAKFLFDDTTADYQSETDGGATFLAVGTRYRPPQLLVDIAIDDQESVVRERHGVFLDTNAPLEDAPVAPYGKDFADPANLPFWWSLGGLGLWQMARTGLAQATEHKLWDTELFAQVKLIAAINNNDPELVRAWLHQFDAIVNFGFLGEANTYAYRHRKVSLASVLDHRFGEMRDQVHIWQAAIDEDAMVFTTHPLTPPKVTEDWNDDESPGYWTGEASMPRSAQYRRTAVHIYQPAWSEATDATLNHALEIPELAEDDRLFLLGPDLAQYIDEPAHLRIVLKDVLDGCTLGFGHVEDEWIGYDAA